MTVMFLFCYSCVSLLQAVYFADYAICHMLTSVREWQSRTAEWKAGYDTMEADV